MTRGTKQPGAGEALRPQRTTVILFRQPSTPISTDAYLKSFEAACFSPQCIGVLEQALVDIDSLTRVIDKGPDSWAGVIATSTRSGEAWVAGAKLSTKSQAGTIGECNSVCGELTAIDWSTMPLYVPGISTAEPFERSGLPINLVPTLDSAIRHSPPGSASRLAEFIITHTSASDRPFLFLTGDKTLPELPDRLREAGRKLTLHQVYKTGERPGLRGDLRQRFEHDTGNQWLAFFAPSSAQMVLDHLDDLGVSLPRSKTLGSTLRLAAIGQTTTTYLENRGLVAHATAEHPTPAGLLNAIQHAEK